MRTAPTALAALMALAALAGCMGGTTSTSSGPAPVAQPRFALGNITTVDDGTVGVSEPSILADYQGALWISGPTGFVTPATQHNPKPYTHDTSMFKSTDGGRTWTNMVQVPGYGRDACPGGGDSDITAGPDGAVYLVDLYLGNVPIDVTRDGGSTWTSNCYTSITPYVDRQWIAADGKSAWVSVNSEAMGTLNDEGLPGVPHQSTWEVYRSDFVGAPTDGLLFQPPVFVPSAGPIVVDQQDGTLYLAGSGATMYASTDRGATFIPHDTGLKGHDLSNSFVSIALDAQGSVFVAGAGSHGIVVSGSKDKGKTWTPGVEFEPYPVKVATKTDNSTNHAEYAFAWLAAGGNGTIDVAWYGQPPHAGANTTYYVYALQKTGFLDDPANATFDWTQVTPQPIATKPLCIGIELYTVDPMNPQATKALTPCDADGKHTRALGDFFEGAVDQKGALVIAFDDANGHEPPQLKFARQTLGALAPPQKPK